MPQKCLKVRIGLKVDGRGRQTAAYPDFNRIAPALRGSMDWSYFVDLHGGWHYDKVSGHQEEDLVADSPRGTQWGMLVVPDTFADEAVRLFPTSCSLMNDIEAGVFYNTRAHAHEPEIREDAEVLSAIAQKRALQIPESQEDLNALNPDHPLPGRRRNPLKTWAQFKTRHGIV